MTLYEKGGGSDLASVLGFFASFSGDAEYLYREIGTRLGQIEGFHRFQILDGPESNGACNCSRFSAPVQSTGSLASIEASPSGDFSRRDWNCVAAVIAGAMHRVGMKEAKDQRSELPSHKLASLLIIKDRHGRFLHVNKAFADLYDTDCKSMIGKTDVDFHGDRELFEKYLLDDRKAIDSGEPVYIPFEENTSQRDGKSTRFETVKIPLKNDTDGYDRVLIVATPLSEQPRYDVSLGFQNSFLFQVIDESPNWVYVKDKEGRFVYANRAACEVFGKTKQEMLGKTDYELNPHPGRDGSVNNDDKEVITTLKRRFIHEEKIRGHNGVEHWIQAVKNPIIEPDGSCDKVLVVCVPIDEQRASARMLQESQRFLREVINSNPNLILVKDHEGKFLLVNQAVAELYGSTISNLEGKTDSDFSVNPDDLRRFRKTDRKVLKSGPPLFIASESVTNSSGEIRWFQTIKKRIESKSGESPRLLVVCTDITEQLAARDKLRNAKERAVLASKAKTDFLTRMSHELRTPLNAMLGFNQLLQQDKDLTPGQVDTLDIINNSGKHLLSLISDILEMSKIEMGEIKLNIGQFDIHKLVREVVDLFEAKASANDTRLTLEISPEIPRLVATDEVKLRQVVMNLVSNAVKFTHEGEIVVSIANPAAGVLKVTVSDNGPGIAPSEIDKVFEVFRQTESGRNSQGGAGLGLSISKKLVHLMEGEIFVESEEGHGSTFFFEIPLREVTGFANPISPEGETSRVSGEGYRVLVADDAPANRKFVTQLLNRLGYDTLEVVNGLEAVSCHLDNKLDLILMDINMPEMDGLTATATIRANEENLQMKRVPIIALTANAFEEHRRKAREAGCDDFVAKPFEFADLVSAIVNQLPKDNLLSGLAR